MRRNRGPRAAGSATLRRLAIESLETRLYLTGNFLASVVAGQVTAGQITEASGLAASQLNDGVLWTHNDSGDGTHVYAIDETGGLQGVFTLDGAAGADYEDIAVGPGPVPGVSYLFVGDIGDNGASRSNIRVHRMAEPTVDGSNQTITGIDTLTFTYPDGARDAETLLVDPISGDLYVVTKRDTLNRVYRAAAPAAGNQSATLEYVGAMTWGGGALTGAVGGDVSSTGREILIKAYATVYLYDRAPGTALHEALLAAPAAQPPYTIEPQGEAIGFNADGEHYYTLSEGGSPNLLFYERAGNADTTTALFQHQRLPDAGYAGAADVEIRQASPGTNFGAAGSINVDGDEPGGSGDDAAALLRWDVSSIPTDQTILSASISLAVSDGTSDPYTFFESLRPWIEGEATWNQFAAGQSWQTPGAAGPNDRGSTPLAALGPSGTGAVSIPLNAAGVAVVQSWIDNPANNRGLIVADTTSDNGVDFNSRENTVVESRPLLSITFGDASEIPPEVAVHHEPYLQLGDAPLDGFAGSETDRVDVMWQTIAAGPGDQDDFIAQYRRAGDTLWTNIAPPTPLATGVETRVNHTVGITGLAFDAAYEYRVRHLRAGNIIETYQSDFETRLPPGDATPFTFVAYGDSAYTPNVDNFREVQARINGLDPAFALLLGDNAYTQGTHPQLDARFDPAINPEAAAWTAGHIDYFGFGNHDIGSAAGKPTEDNISVPIPLAGVNAAAAPPVGERSEHNYSFDYGDVHFITFDSNSLDDAARLNAQLAYVEADLAASDATWKIVFAHHPVAGVPEKNEDPGDNYYQQVVPRLHAAGVDLLLVGHSHTFSWTKPLLGESGGAATFVNDTDKDYAKGAGLVQVVSGLGGREIRPGSYSQFPFVAAGYTSGTSPAGEYGFAQIDVTPAQLTVRYVTADDGATLDRFTITGGAIVDVLASGSGWTDSFLANLEPGAGIGPRGFSLAAVSGSDAPLPWNNVNRFIVRFGVDTPDVQMSDLALAGHAGPLNFANFSYVGLNVATGTYDAVWTLAAPIVADNLQLTASAPGASAQFAASFSVLAGDANRSRTVNILDGLAIRDRLFTSIGNPAYDPFRDITADGTINILDGLAVRNHLFTSLPDPATSADVGDVGREQAQRRSGSGPAGTSQSLFTVSDANHEPQSVDPALHDIAPDIAMAWEQSNRGQLATRRAFSC